MTKIDFTGGLRNQFISEKEDLAASYRLLINARVRDNAVRPIELPVEDNTLPAGLRQGLYAFDQYVLAFVAGAVVMFGFPSFQVSLPDLVPASTSWRPSVCRTRSGTSAASSGRRSLRSRLQREASSSRCGATRSASSP